MAAPEMAHEALEYKRLTEKTAEFYRRRAREYARQTLSIDLEENWRVFGEFVNSGARVLDAGCGAGRDLTVLSDRGYDIIGVDLSLPLCLLAAKHSGGRVLCADVRRLPFADSSFDAVRAAASFVHYPDAIVRIALTEVRRVLKAQGVLVASVKHGRGSETIADGRWFNLFELENWESHLKSSKLRPLMTRLEDEDSWLLSVSHVVA